MDSLRRMMGTLERLRQLSPEMTISCAICLLGVSMYPEGIPQDELKKVADVGQSTLSRYLAALGERGERGKPGLGLVIVTPDPADYRRNLVKLSKKGERFIAKHEEA